jgi:predicted dehydrogenase
LTVLVGVVGFGRWGANVVRDLLALGAEITVAEPDDARRGAAGLAGATHCVETAECLPDCDGYIVATPARVHRDICEVLLERDTPVFVEKPPCTNLAEVEALAAQARDRIFVMHKWRYHPGIRVLAELTASGGLGEPARLETTRTGPGSLPSDVDVLWHLGTHDLSIAVEILDGLAPIREVHATRDSTGRITRCSVAMGQEANLEHRMLVAAGVPDHVRRFVVSGSEGSAVLDGAYATTLTVHRRAGVETLAVPHVQPLVEELRTFMAHLAGGPPPVSNFSTAVDIARHLSEMQRTADRAAV